jgi:branched-chain amino acid transport system substrate-binding protein
MFHFCPTTDDYGKQTTRFASEVIRPAINQKYGYSPDRPLRLAVVYQDSPYGKGVLAAVASTIEKEGLPVELVSNQSFKMGESDFRTILTSVKAAPGCRLLGGLLKRAGADDYPGPAGRGPRHHLPRGRVQRRP